MAFFFKKKTDRFQGNEPEGLIVGLGNPGSKYEGTRHNLGFRVVTSLLEVLHHDRETRLEPQSSGKKFQSLLWRCHWPKTSAIWLVAMPQTYMNLSGTAVQPLLAWYKLPPQKLLVVHDELDLAPGRIMLKAGGGLAGHNGLKSIAEQLGSRDFYRLRLGIGRPAHKEDLLGWVLGNFASAEAQAINEVLPLAVDAIVQYGQEGPEKTAGKVNSKTRVS